MREKTYHFNAKFLLRILFLLIEGADSHRNFDRLSHLYLALCEKILIIIVSYKAGGVYAILVARIKQMPPVLISQL